MKTTPIYALPYPEESDSADVPRDVQALAVRLDTILPNVGIPTGGGIDWYSSAAPAGFLLCDGSAISRTTHAALFAAIGVIYGGGDGITTFNLPDTRGRVLVGVAPTGGHADMAALGANDGAALQYRRPRHNHGNTLTLPAHGHAVSDPGHAHPIYPDYARVGGPGGGPINDQGWREQTQLAVLSAQTGIGVGNPTSYPAIPGLVGVTNAPNEGPSYVVAAKAIKT